MEITYVKSRVSHFSWYATLSMWSFYGRELTSFLHDDDRVLGCARVAGTIRAVVTVNRHRLSIITLKGGVSTLYITEYSRGPNYIMVDNTFGKSVQKIRAFITIKLFSCLFVQAVTARDKGLHM